MALEHIVEGQDVILVGNSNLLNTQKKGKEIDSFECVIRFNKAIEYLSDPDTTGIRTTGWIFAMLKEHIVQTVFRNATYKPEYCIRYGVEPLIISGRKNFLFNNKKPKQECRDKLNIRNDKHPSTGVVTLLYILSHCNPKSVTITGFDSFKNANFYTTTNANEKYGWHEAKKEAEYIKQQIDTEKVKTL